MGTFALLTAMPLLVLGAAFPQIAAVTDPIGWAAALWGVFLYWWAGILYALQAGRLIRIPVDAAGGPSDSLDI
jgi:cardiolipin synthase